MPATDLPKEQEQPKVRLQLPLVNRGAKAPALVSTVEYDSKEIFELRVW